MELSYLNRFLRCVPSTGTGTLKSVQLSSQRPGRRPGPCSESNESPLTYSTHDNGVVVLYSSTTRKATVLG